MIKGFPTRKDSIILAAIDIINEKGIQSLSTKEIALKQGISESLLYKYFNSLDEVLIAVIEYFSQFDDMIVNTVLKRDISHKEKILEASKSLVELYESYPALASILLNYETLMNYSHTKEIANEIINRRLRFLEKVIEMGQDNGEFENYYTSKELAIIIIGTFRSLIMNWKMSGYKFPIKKEMLMVIKKILEKA